MSDRRTSESEEFLTPYSTKKSLHGLDEEEDSKVFFEQVPPPLDFSTPLAQQPETPKMISPQQSHRSNQTDGSIQNNLPPLETRASVIRPTLVRQGNTTTRNSAAQISRRLVVSMNQTKLGRFLNRIEPLVIALIVINSIMIGIGTFDFVEQNESIERAFEITDDVFLGLFTVELALNLIWYFRLDRLKFDGCVPYTPRITAGEKSKRRRDRPWLIFDIVIIGISWIFRSTTSSSTSPDAIKLDTSVVRAFRVLRTFRLLSKVKSLKNLMRALVHVFPKMGALGFITVLLFIVFGVLTTVLFRNTLEKAIDEGKEDAFGGYDYFGNFHLSLLTLFQMMTFDNWHDPARAVMSLDGYGWNAGWIFVLWVFISGFVIMNLIIAIICESLVTMNEMGIMALHGQMEDSTQEIMTDFEASHDASAIKMELYTAMGIRLTQLESTVEEMLQHEDEVLTRLQRLLEQNK